ncbi:ribosomal protein L7/L12 [Pyxidicoccus trucidator]|uniref:ribosomal protein L7/L12 n=1 Tax=Pyxidicoccus trucidator TaxID=2709662 RepID=UPI0013DB2D29|nr:ribosomal protein L7/L12 [Pyxidicoccus trucidator]
MKVQVWNAFASNNSGSYTLVGRFPNETLAADVAAELARVAAEHNVWMEERHQKGWDDDAPPSPLEIFMQHHGLTPVRFTQLEDVWPEHSDINTPRVWAQGHQVFVHHGCTVTLPPTFGEYFYKRGGRVETELDHSHHPLIGVFQLRYPYAARAGQDVPALALRALDALYAEDGPLVQLTHPEPLPAWRVGERFGDGDLTVGAVFTDLVEGFTTVDRIARAHGFTVEVKVFESWDRKGDALAFLRPCIPPLPTRELFDVVLTGATSQATLAVTGMIEELRQVDPKEARALLDSAPAPVRRRLPRGVAEAMASRLQRVGARVEVRPSEP